MDATYTSAIPVAPDWYTRLLAERAELSDRLAKLRYFLHTDAFDELDTANAGLLRAQAEVMASYLAILETRIGLAVPNRTPRFVPAGTVIV